MNPIVELIPSERDAKAKRMYVFMRWFLRYHRKEIQAKADNAIFMMMAYGNNLLEKLESEFEDWKFCKEEL